MTRTHAYGILDLFALVSKLLAPFTDAIRAEFAVKAIDRPRPSSPPQPAPTPAPVEEPATPVAVVPPVADTLPVKAPTEVSATARLFVRKKTGGQWRYHPARPDATGPKFRRRHDGKRVRYEPLNATSQESAR